MLAVCVSVCPSSCISFPDDNLSKHQWIFTKLGMGIDIVAVWFGIANGQIHKNFAELSAGDTPIFSFLYDTLSKCQWIFTRFSICIHIVEICSGIVNGQTLSIFDRVICLYTIMAGYYIFTFRQVVKWKCSDLILFKMCPLYSAKMHWNFYQISMKAYFVGTH